MCWLLIPDLSNSVSPYYLSFIYMLVHPSKADPTFEVTLLNATQWQNYGTPNMAGELKMKWNHSLMETERVNIELWGYREVSGSAAGGTPSPRAELRYLYSLARDLPNAGVFVFIPEPREDFSDWELGNIRVTASSESEGERLPRHL